MSREGVPYIVLPISAGQVFSILVKIDDAKLLRVNLSGVRSV